MKRHFLISIIWLILLPAAQSQAQGVREHLETIIESIIENLDEETDAIQLAEDLERLANNPLNLNSATAEEISLLHILNEVQIKKLLEYRKEYGPIYSIYELRTVDGLTPEQLEKMIPFVKFDSPSEDPQQLKSALKYGRHEIIGRSQIVVQKQNGFQQNEEGLKPFEGDRAKYYLRYRFRAGERISAGLTADKDAGEAFFSGSNKYGFDFYSAHISFKINNVIKDFTAGDYYIKAGQGLVLWQGYSGAKSAWVLDVSKKGQGSSPFTSTDENRFFRGLTATLKAGNGTLNLFWSSKRNDANLEDSDTEGLHFTSLQTSGYHRTASETEDEKSVRHVNAGAIASWSFKNLRIGSTFIHQQFSLPWIRSDQLYNKFLFSGDRTFNFGTDYLYNRGKYIFFGEAAISKSGGKAFLQGAGVYIHDQLSLSLLVRHFDKQYHALWGNPFAGGLSPDNESGVYAGVKFLPVKYVILSGYYDFSRSKWITYNSAAPSFRNDFFVQADLNFSPNINFYIRYKYKEQEQKTEIDGRYINLTENTRRLRIHLQFMPSEIFILRTRLEYIQYRSLVPENGYMVYQDVNFSPNSTPLRFNFRLAWFDTDSYNSAIYAYENDLLYTFAIPAYFGQGWRAYINLRYNLTKNLELWLKLGNTLRTDVKITGTGYNRIDGNQKTEVKLQLRLKI